jgi:hypothetical protein
MRTDRQTNMMKLTIVFRNFANAPKELGPSKEAQMIAFDSSREGVPLEFSAAYPTALTGDFRTPLTSSSQKPR